MPLLVFLKYKNIDMRSLAIEGRALSVIENSVSGCGCDVDAQPVEECSSESIGTKKSETESETSSDQEPLEPVDCRTKKTLSVVAKTIISPILPDPKADISPDEFILQLVEAQWDVSLEVKNAFSLDSYFREITEEQMAAYTPQVVSVVRNNDLDSLKALHREGQDLNCFNRFGESLLNMACRRGFESIVEYLLEQGGADLRSRDDFGRTPLHDTCWNPLPQLKICKWIIERDPSLFLVSDKRGCTPFQYTRPQHWDTWRKFLFDNRGCLFALVQPDLLPKLLAEKQ